MCNCPLCGAANAEDAPTCQKCGTRLSSIGDAAADCTAATAPVVEPPGRMDPDAPTSEQQAPAPPPSYAGMDTPPTLPIPPPPMSEAPASVGSYPQQRSQLGLWAFLIGLFSLLLCCGLTGPVAIVLAVQARKDPTADQGLATTGLVLGIISLVIMALFILMIILMAVLIPSMALSTPLGPEMTAAAGGTVA
ncbi:MAG: hypothetical protein ACYC7E_20815 [Armatimonadota bacterium]